MTAFRGLKRALLACTVLLCGSGLAQADSSFNEIFKQVNPKMVKVFGAGGYRGVTAYCTGVLISPDGLILTVYSPTLDTRELRVHLYDGQRHECELIAAEPQLDVALIRIKDGDKKFKSLPLDHFDLSKPPSDVKVGEWVLGLSNLFEIATGREPVSVQRGVVAAIAPLSARRGVNEATYKGTVFIVDAIICNPGSHGGALVNLKGEFIGVIGKELKNTLTETWVNYAMPVKDLRDFVEKARKGNYKPLESKKPDEIVDKGAYTGIIFVPNVLERTPAYVEEVLPNSPAAKAGLKPNDLIVFLRLPLRDGSGESEERLVASINVYKELMAPVEPGTKLEVIVRRDKQLMRVDLESTKRPAPPTPVKTGTGPTK
jgi:serine protease Do